jgi:Uma2 family endonuclease
MTGVTTKGSPGVCNRYELDGTLFVSPALSRQHQRVLLKLAFALEANCTPEFEVLPAPFAVRPSNSTELQPDVLVARKADLTEKLLPVAPALAVEIFSPSSVINDLNNKKAAYERLGVAAYWVIDPQQPAMIVFELDDGRYRQVAEVTGDDAYEARHPFPVRVVPAELQDIDR